MTSTAQHSTACTAHCTLYTAQLHCIAFSSLGAHAAKPKLARTAKHSKTQRKHKKTHEHKNTSTERTERTESTKFSHGATEPSTGSQVQARLSDRLSVACGPVRAKSSHLARQVLACAHACTQVLTQLAPSGQVNGHSYPHPTQVPPRNLQSPTTLKLSTFSPSYTVSCFFIPDLFNDCFVHTIQTHTSRPMSSARPQTTHQTRHSI